MSREALGKLRRKARGVRKIQRSEAKNRMPALSRGARNNEKPEEITKIRKRMISIIKHDGGGEAGGGVTFCCI